MSEKRHYYTARVLYGESIGVRLPGFEYVLTVEEARKMADSIDDALDHLDGTIDALKDAINDPPVRTLTSEEFKLNFAPAQHGGVLQAVFHDLDGYQCRMREVLSALLKQGRRMLDEAVSERDRAFEQSIGHETQRKVANLRAEKAEAALADRIEHCVKYHREANGGVMGNE